MQSTDYIAAEIGKEVLPKYRWNITELYHLISSLNVNDKYFPSLATHQQINTYFAKFIINIQILFIQYII